MTTWLSKTLAKLEINYHAEFEVSPVAGDASFRRYFRVLNPEFSFIVMDAPPEKENSAPFVEIAAFWKAHKIDVPKIIAQDLEKGFLLLEDFGDTQFFTAVDNKPESHASLIYRAAIKALQPIQQLPNDYASTLPRYDEALLRREMALFTDWLIHQALRLKLSLSEQSVIDNAFTLLVKQALKQPQVVVHRDYHSRNLMLLQDSKIGIIDFQDAVFGPATYDLVSLLRDCYIEWPQTFIDAHCQEFLDTSNVPELQAMSLANFTRDFDLMGMQRHLKASGIFARLALRDKKYGYLADVPRTLNYIVQVAAKYDELEAFGKLVSNRVLPAFQEFLNEHKSKL
jgi:aminoglycoside/choline kinase family phosphotransferase